MKVALVTGGSQGIGRATVLELAQRGHRVVFTYRTGHQAAQDLVNQVRDRGGEALSLHLDVADLASIREFLETLDTTLWGAWGERHIDFLFNNAGIGGYNRIENVTVEEFDTMLNVHFRGPFFLTQGLLPRMRDGGHIVNMSSATVRVAFEGCAPYASMKGAMEVLTRYLAKELGPRKIRVNGVAPGAIRTNLAGGLDGAPELVQLLTDMTALGRIGEPSDVARVVAGLFSEDFGWVNGQCIEISGGMNL